MKKSDLELLIKEVLVEEGYIEEADVISSIAQGAMKGAAAVGKVAGAAISGAVKQGVGALNQVVNPQQVEKAIATDLKNPIDNTKDLMKRAGGNTVKIAKGIADPKKRLQTIQAASTGLIKLMQDKTTNFDLDDLGDLTLILSDLSGFVKQVQDKKKLAAQNK